MTYINDTLYVIMSYMRTIVLVVVEDGRVAIEERALTDVDGRQCLGGDEIPIYNALRHRHWGIDG